MFFNNKKSKKEKQENLEMEITLADMIFVLSYEPEEDQSIYLMAGVITDMTERIISNYGNE